MSQQAQVFDDIRGSLRNLEQRMDTGFAVVDRRFDGLDQRMSRQFVWLAGMIFTVLVAVVGALIARG